jgi:hypothetical protein
MVGTARTPITFKPAERRCCVMFSLSDFVVEEHPGAVTPVTLKYEGDVQEKHISLCYDRHKSGRGAQIHPVCIVVDDAKPASYRRR